MNNNNRVGAMGKRATSQRVGEEVDIGTWGIAGGESDVGRGDVVPWWGNSQLNSDWSFERAPQLPS